MRHVPSGAKVRIATRGSKLALIQAQLASEALQSVMQVDVELVVVKTSGDQQSSTPVDKLIGQGWFTSELEVALYDYKADIAVHSAKDLPNELAKDCEVVAYLDRDDPRDALISNGGVGFADLEVGARVATSSPRRQALLNEYRPDLEVVPVRGNVDTRLKKLADGEFDALVLACAGMDRLGVADQISERLGIDWFVPAPAQGVIALETLTTSAYREVCQQLDSVLSRGAIQAERAVLRQLGGGCLLPLGAYAEIKENLLLLKAILGTDSGLRGAEVSGNLSDYEVLAAEVANKLQQSRP